MKAEIVVIGASLGGLHALEVVLGALPESFSLPIAVVQHRGQDSEERLVALLEKHTALSVCEPGDKDEIAPGRVHLAPCDYHLLIEAGGFGLSTEAPVCHARPSIDVLFESAANIYEDRVVGVILTGANQDGAQGAANIRKRGGLVVVQDPKTAESGTMPQAVLEATQVDHVLALAEIGPFLVELAVGNRTKR